MAVRKAAGGRIAFCAVLTIGEFRVMWLADFLSSMGDQFARVALAVLVFDRTDSAALTGLVYALTFVPAVLGALTLSSTADRRSRRAVMVTADAFRAIVVATMVVPGVPLAGLCLLVAIMSFLGGPYKAAQLALLRDVLHAEQYPAGMALRQITNQAAELAGFGLGGILSASFSPQICLGVDLATFAASALLVGCFVQSRPAASPSGRNHSITAGAKMLWGEPRQRAIVLTTVLGLFYIAPDGLAAPYTAQLGYGSTMVGFVLASGGAGAILVLPLFLRFVPAGRRPVALPIACLAAGLPLTLVPVGGGIYVAIFLFAATEAIWSVQVVMSVSFLAELLPDSHRAQGMGLAGSMNITAQGLGIGLAGLAGQATSPSIAIGLSGAASVLVALWPSALLARSRTIRRTVSGRAGPKSPIIIANDDRTEG